MIDTSSAEPAPPAAPAEPTPTPAPSRSMNLSHVTAAGGVTGMLASVLMWLSHWPLQPLTADTSASIAGLLVAAAAGVAAWRRRKPTA